MFKRIKQLRKQNNLSVTEIAKFLNISEKNYLKFENGQKNIPLDLLYKLAQKYNTSIDYIVEETNSFFPHKRN